MSFFSLTPLSVSDSFSSPNLDRRISSLLSPPFPVKSARGLERDHRNLRITSENPRWFCRRNSLSKSAWSTAVFCPFSISRANLWHSVGPLWSSSPLPIEQTLCWELKRDYLIHIRPGNLDMVRGNALLWRLALTMESDRTGCALSPLSWLNVWHSARSIRSSSSFPINEHCSGNIESDHLIHVRPGHLHMVWNMWWRWAVTMIDRVALSQMDADVLLFWRFLEPIYGILRDHRPSFQLAFDFCKRRGYRSLQARCLRLLSIFANGGVIRVV